MALGGGREKKADPIDYSVGVEIHHKVGDRVNKGDPLFTLHASEPKSLKTASKRVLSAYDIVAEKVSPLPLFYDTISG
jgi:pyrimidine-nucleoside phosphorylase